MRYAPNVKLVVAIAGCVAAFASTAVAFEGRINAELTRGTETNALLYTVDPERLRIAMTSTNWPHPVNIVELKSGAVTLVFPHNRSFVRLKPATDNAAVPPGGALGETRPTTAPPMPMPPGGLPPGVGPQPQTGAGPGVPTMPAMPAPFGAGPPMPMMPLPPSERAEFKATGETTNILSFACSRYELKQRGETLEVWATDKLLPFQPYQRNQSPRFGPSMIEEQWPKLLTDRKLFPLLVSLHYDNGTERLRFEVKSVTPEKITDTDGKLFQPPTDYHEMQPLPF